MLRASDFRQKEVVNVADGKRLGFVYDVEIDMEKGILEAIIVPGPSEFLGIFGRSADYIIPWDYIRKIGDDIILVEINDSMAKQYVD